ncbi:MAG: phosphate signaling complex protein PhoU [Planctomycetes bacterium]|nr:phosphate signaling complex protein PhoU [Planctomycetota bacterium]
MTQIRHFDLELAELKRSLVSMGNLVEQTVELCVKTILQPALEVRDEVSSIEERIDELETVIEERCHQIISLQSPMARDLRFLISATRITSDLEQVGDLAESIAKRAHYIAKHQLVRNPTALNTLGALARKMIHEAIEAFVSGDIDIAKSILLEEDDADRRTKDCYKEIQASMESQPDLIKEYTHLLRAVGHLEHIADIAVSIAEEAVYIHRGQLIRHQHQEHLDADAGKKE